MREPEEQKSPTLARFHHDPVVANLAIKAYRAGSLHFHTIQWLILLDIATLAPVLLLSIMKHVSTEPSTKRTTHKPTTDYWTCFPARSHHRGALVFLGIQTLKRRVEGLVDV